MEDRNVEGESFLSESISASRLVVEVCFPAVDSDGERHALIADIASRRGIPLRYLVLDGSEFSRKAPSLGADSAVEGVGGAALGIKLEKLAGEVRSAMEQTEAPAQPAGKKAWAKSLLSQDLDAEETTGETEPALRKAKVPPVR